MKTSEKRLLFGLLGMLFLGAGVLGSDFYFKKRDELQVEKTNLENEWITIETLFEEREVWELRAEWLERHQPKFTSTEEIDQAIFKEAIAAEVEGVETSKQALLPTVTMPDYVQSGVALSAAGDLASVFGWLNDLNKPEAFRVVRNIKVSPDKEDAEKIVAQFELLRWYAPPEGGVTESVPATDSISIPDASQDTTPPSAEVTSSPADAISTPANAPAPANKTVPNPANEIVPAPPEETLPAPETLPPTDE